MSKINQIKKTNLFNQLQAALREDCNRFIEDESDLESWEEYAISCPSDQLDDLMAQIPEEDADLWFELVDQEIQVVVSEYRLE